MQKLIQSFIDSTNAFDVEKALSLFAPNAVINDASVGSEFSGHAGIRTYLERFFVGYKTSSKLLCIESLSGSRAIVHLDFTGDFGHETGTLDISVNGSGLIETIQADLD
jgi:ketosteroid isomerase-like protein